MIDDFFDKITLYLSTSDFVEKFSVIKRKITISDGYIRIQIVLLNSDFIELSLYCQIKNLHVNIIDYRIHWQNKNGDLIKRWDNCRHHQGIENIPYHIHICKDKIITVLPGKEIDIFNLLSEIENALLKKSSNI
jgi:hypothetical protein